MYLEMEENLLLCGSAFNNCPIVLSLDVIDWEHNLEPIKEITGRF